MARRHGAVSGAGRIVGAARAKKSAFDGTSCRRMPRKIPGSETPYPVGLPNWQGIYNAVVTGTALSYKVE